MALYTGLATAPQWKRLEAFFGIDQEMQRRIGTFVLLASMVEMATEHAAWLLTEEKFGDKPPKTDRMQMSDVLSVVRNSAMERIADTDIRNLMLLTIDAADDLLVIRHTIVHGRPLAPSSTKDGPYLVRNKSWIGEKRKRPATRLKLNQDVMDELTEAGDFIHRSLGQICGTLTGNWPREATMELMDKVAALRARLEMVRAEAEKPSAD